MHILLKKIRLQISHIRTGDPIEQQSTRHLLQKSRDGHINRQKLHNRPKKPKRSLQRHFSTRQLRQLSQRRRLPAHVDVEQDRRTQEDREDGRGVTREEIGEPQRALGRESRFRRGRDEVLPGAHEGEEVGDQAVRAAAHGPHALHQAEPDGELEDGDELVEARDAPAATELGADLAQLRDYVVVQDSACVGVCYGDSVVGDVFDVFGPGHCEGPEVAFFAGVDSRVDLEG